MCVYIFFPGVHIQSGGPVNDIRLNIQKSMGNKSRSNSKDIIGSGMSLLKVHFLKIWVVKAFTAVVLKSYFRTQYTKNTHNIKDIIRKKF